MKHYKNLDDVTEWARHYDWPIRNGNSLQKHLQTVLEVYYNEQENFKCNTKCDIKLLVKRGHTNLAFSATIAQSNQENKSFRLFRVDGFVVVYARVELIEMPDRYYLPKLFTHITGQETNLE